MNGPNQIDESSKLKWPSRIVVIIFYPYSHSSLLDIALPGSSLIPVSPETEKSILLKRMDKNSSLCNACTGFFYILVTVHLGIILINNQLDAQFPLYTFISILYVFRATMCSSSGESIVSIQHLVYVTLCRWHIPDVVLIQLTLLMMSTLLLETCTESK